MSTSVSSTVAAAGNSATVVLDANAIGQSRYAAAAMAASAAAAKAAAAVLAANMPVQPPPLSAILLQTDPLHRACKAGDWREAKSLIERCGASRQARCKYVNRKDSNGSSPIFHCVWYGYYRVLALLLYHGANPNLQNNRRNTALHLVCEQMHWQCAQLMLQAGARIDIENWEGKTSIDFIPKDQDKSAEFISFVTTQAALYAKEQAMKMDLFVLQNTASDTAKNISQQQQNGTSGILENESLRRLCWSVQHLEKGSHTSSAAQATQRPTAAIPTTTSGSTPTTHSNRSSLPSPAYSLELNGGRDFYSGRIGTYMDDPAHASLDPELLAPIQAMDWHTTQMNQTGGISALPSPSLTAARPSPTVTSFSAAAAALAAASPAPSASTALGKPPSAPPASLAINSTQPPVAAPQSGINIDAKTQLKSALVAFHKLALKYPHSNLGPGLEIVHPPQAVESNLNDCTDAHAPEDQGPALSYHGLSHLLVHLASHWPGLPVQYKKYFLSFLIRFASNVSNAACMVSSTRPVADAWVNDSPPNRPVLLMLVDAVLDWLELRRGLCSTETDCSLLPQSKTFISVAQSFGMHVAQTPSRYSVANTVAPTIGGTTAAVSGRNSVLPTPNDRRASGSVYGAAFANLANTNSSNNASVTPQVPPSPAGPPILTRNTSYSSQTGRAIPSPSLAALSTTTAVTLVNPYLHADTYIDDFEISSLLMELVASILFTLRTKSGSITADMITGSKGALEEMMKQEVTQEEMSYIGSLKTYTSGGGGGLGSIASCLHPHVASYASASRESVPDAAADKAISDQEHYMEQKVAHRLTVLQSRGQSIFSPRNHEAVNPGNLDMRTALAAADAPQFPSAAGGGSKSARGVMVDRSISRLWRNVVRIFESHSSTLHILNVIIRAPFPPNVHPALSLRVVYLMKEGFSSLKLWHPLLCDQFRSRELINFVTFAMKNIQYLVAKEENAAAKHARGKEFWKHAFELVANQVKTGSAQNDGGQQKTTPTMQTQTLLEKQFQNAVVGAHTDVNEKLQNLAQVVESKEERPIFNPDTGNSLLKPLRIASKNSTLSDVSESNTPVALDQPVGGPETQREIRTILQSELDQVTGATAMVKKLTVEDAQSAKLKPRSLLSPTSHLRADSWAESISSSQPYSPRFSLRSSPSSTALELAQSHISGAMAAARAQRQRETSDRLRSATQSSKSKFKLSVKERVKEQMTKEKAAQDLAELKRVEDEANTVQKIADPTRPNGVVSIQASNLASPKAGQRQSSPVPPSASGVTSPSGSTVATASSQYAAATSALPDFYSARVIASRMMLADRCCDFVLSLVLDSAKRAAKLEERKQAAALNRANEEQRAKAKQESEEQRRGMTSGALSRKPFNPPAPDPMDIVHETTGHRTLKGVNDLYGPPPLTTLCASLVDWGVVDSLLMVLSPLNQSLSAHRIAYARRTSKLNSEGINLLTSDNENIGVHQAAQSLCYLLRMDSSIDLIYISPHALALYDLLSTHTDEQVANSLMYILSHLLRKRRWNDRLMALKGKNPHAFLTSHEQVVEESRKEEEMKRVEQKNKEMEQERRINGEVEHLPDSFTSYLPLEYLLMRWARIAVQISLACLPLKPWSTLPPTALLSNIPSRPSELPPKMLVYEAMDDATRAAVDKARHEEDLKKRLAEAAERRKKIEKEREEQMQLNRLFLQQLHPAYAASPTNAMFQQRIPFPSSPSHASHSLSIHPLALEHATSSAVPPEKSWFALHYTPPTAQQKIFVLQLQKQQRKKLQQKLGLLKLRLNNIGGNVSAEPSPYNNGLDSATVTPRSGETPGAISLKPLSWHDVQMNAALSASGAAPPFTPLATYRPIKDLVEGGVAAQQIAAQMYRQSFANRMGDFPLNVSSTSPASSPASLASNATNNPAGEGNADSDPSVLVVQKFLSELPSPTGKARTLVHVASTTSGRASPSLADVVEASQIGRVLSPMNKSLQDRLENAPAKVGSLLPSPRTPRDPASPVPALSLVNLLDQQQQQQQQAAAAANSTRSSARRSGSHRAKFSFGTGEGSAIQNFLRESARSEQKNMSPLPDIQQEAEADPSDDEDDDEDGSSSESDASSDLNEEESKNPLKAEEKRRAREQARALKQAELDRTEEARQKILAARAAGQGPRSLRLNSLAALKTAGAMSSRLDVDQGLVKPDSSRSKSSVANAPGTGIGTVPSFANVALAESLLYRVLHCFFAFTRYERDALRLVESGALEFIAGLINHPVFDISLHALKLFTLLTTRFSEDFLVQLMEGLVRPHVSNCWLGISIGRTAEGKEVGFPWCTLDSLVQSCADRLRVDQEFQMARKTGDSAPQLRPPSRDERSALSFQLLVNISQDPKGRGYAAVQRHSVWYENLLSDVLSHPSLMDLEDRQKRFQRVAPSLVHTHGFPFKVEQEERSISSLLQSIHSGSAASLVSHSRKMSASNSTTNVNNPHGRRPSTAGSLSIGTTLSPTLMGRRSRSPSVINSPLLAPGTPPVSSANSMRPNSKVKVKRPSMSIIDTDTFVSGGRSTTGDALHRLASVSNSTNAGSPNAKLSIIPVTPFGGHWNTAGGVPFDRFYPGGSGFTAYATTDVKGRKLPTADGLDWQLPAASSAGSTELLDMCSEAQLSTQPANLRVCDLRSCGGVEHTVNTFVLCPRCQQVAYCSVAHRRLAWSSWHSRVCSVTRKKTVKPFQTLRYPVRQQHRLTSSQPSKIIQELLNDEVHMEEPSTSVV